MEKSPTQLRDTFMTKLANRLPKLDWYYGMSDDPWVYRKGEAAMNVVKQDLQLLAKLDGGFAAANRLWDAHRPVPIGDASDFLKDPGKFTRIAEKYIVPPETAAELLQFINERMKNGDRYAVFRQDTPAITKDRLYVIPNGQGLEHFSSDRDKRDAYVEQSLYTMKSIVQRVIEIESEKESVLQQVLNRIQVYERAEKRSQNQERLR